MKDDREGRRAGGEVGGAKGGGQRVREGGRGGVWVGDGRWVVLTWRVSSPSRAHTHTRDTSVAGAVVRLCW